jgi:hypothetical protein
VENVTCCLFGFVVDEEEVGRLTRCREECTLTPDGLRSFFAKPTIRWLLDGLDHTIPLAQTPLQACPPMRLIHNRVDRQVLLRRIIWMCSCQRSKFIQSLAITRHTMTETRGSMMFAGTCVCDMRMMMMFCSLCRAGRGIAFARHAPVKRRSGTIPFYQPRFVCGGLSVLLGSVRQGCG